jgi:hypothetical protein
LVTIASPDGIYPILKSFAKWALQVRKLDNLDFRICYEWFDRRKHYADFQSHGKLEYSNR